MPIRSRRVVILALAVLSVCAPLTQAQTDAVWYHNRITWRYGSEGRVWETAVVSPDGKEHYRLALIPLWAVEGGIVGMEIVVASPEHPDDNLLGERKLDVAQPFVITVEELESGINKSRFGTRRDFKLQGFELRAEIQGSRLGEGVGECPNCKNIQELTIDFVFRGNSGKKPRTTATENPVPTNWHKLDAGPFSLFAPAGWEFHQLTGVDSYVGEFAGNSIVLRFDFGGYSNPLKQEKKPTYLLVHKLIGGRGAKIVSPRTPGHGITGIYFRNVGDSNALTLFGHDLISTQQELALEIFETLRFGGPLPRYVLPPPPAKNEQ
jgi:hypothetical protein